MGDLARPLTGQPRPDSSPSSDWWAPDPADVNAPMQLPGGLTRAFDDQLTGYQLYRRRYTSDSVRVSRVDAYDELIDELQEMTGKRLANPEDVLWLSQARSWYTSATVIPGYDQLDLDIALAFQTSVIELLRPSRRQAGPARDYLNNLVQRASPDRMIVRAEEMRLQATEELHTYLGEGDFLSQVGRGLLLLPGALIGGLSTGAPEQIAAAAIGWGAPVRVGAGLLERVATHALHGAAANVAAQAIVEPAILADAIRMGEDYPASQIAIDFALAGVFGAAIGAPAGFRRGVSLRDAAETSPTSARVRPGLDEPGSGEALRAAMAGQAESLVVGALQRDLATLSAIDGLGLDGLVDDIVANDAYLRDANVERPTRPPQRGVREAGPGTIEAAARQADEAPAPAVGRRESVTLNGRTRPRTFQRFPARSLGFDPQTFQYKRAGAQGETDRLQGVESWDGQSAGKLVVFERADGSRVVADGHQRVALAQRLSQGGDEIEIDGYLYREADGWTAQEVRHIAAQKNLRETPGDPIDTAMLMREAPELIDTSIPQRSNDFRTARALARLSDEAFAAVRAGVIPPRLGAIIGDVAADRPEIHAALVDLFHNSSPANGREATFIVREAMMAPAARQQAAQISLFGDDPLVLAGMQERAEVLRLAGNILREDKRAFAAATRYADDLEAAGNILATDENQRRVDSVSALLRELDRLATRPGPVADSLRTIVARAAVEKTSARIAAQQFVDEITRLLDERGLLGLYVDPPARAQPPDKIVAHDMEAESRSAMLRGAHDLDDGAFLQARAEEALQRAMRGEVGEALPDDALGMQREADLERIEDAAEALELDPDPTELAGGALLLARGGDDFDAAARRRLRRAPSEEKAGAAEEAAEPETFAEIAEQRATVKAPFNPFDFDDEAKLREAIASATLPELAKVQREFGIGDFSERTRAEFERAFVGEVFPGGAVGQGGFFAMAGQRSTLAPIIVQAQQWARRSEAYVWERSWNDFGVGVYKGLDGEWRAEIDDSKARFKTEALREEPNIIPKGPDDTIQRFRGRMGDIIDHPGLYRAYPWLADQEVAGVIGWGGRGEYNATTKKIWAQGKDESEALSAALHEVQHLIQGAEGWAAGSNWRHVAYHSQRRLADIEDALRQLDAHHGAIGHNSRKALEDAREAVQHTLEVLGDDGPASVWDTGSRQAWLAYEREHGEVEARNVQTRKDMDAAARRGAMPETTLDVKRSQIYDARDGVALTIPDESQIADVVSEIAPRYGLQIDALMASFEHSGEKRFYRAAGLGWSLFHAEGDVRNITWNTERLAREMEALPPPFSPAALSRAWTRTFSPIARYRVQTRTQLEREMGKYSARLPMARARLDALTELTKRGLDKMDIKSTSLDLRSLLRSSDPRGARFATAGLPSVWGSAVARTAETLRIGKDEPKLTDAMPGSDWWNAISHARGVKQEELHWVGLEDYLKASEGALSREEVVGFIRAHGLQVEETLLGGGGGDAVSQQALLSLIEERSRLRIPSGQDWGEIRTRLNEIEPEIARLQDQVRVERYGDSTRWSSRTLVGGENYRELLLRLPERDNITRKPSLTPLDFYSSHFDQPNILAHVRFNERMDASGRRTLFIEEVQSDWHQTGRKRGYGRPAIAEWTATQSAGRWIVRDAQGYEQGSTSTSFDSSAQEAIDAVALRFQLDSVPDAPFKNNAWASLAMKRMIRWAAENGFEQIAWTRGQRQIERSGLARHVDELTLRTEASGHQYIYGSKNGNNAAGPIDVTESQPLEAIVGAEMAQRLRDASSATVGDVTLQKVGGLDENVEIGGEGMRAFYDRIIPNIANDLGKKYGARVGETTIPVTPTVQETVHALPLTLAMREAVLGAPQDMFARGRQHAAPAPPLGTVSQWHAAARALFPGYGKRALDNGRLTIVQSLDDLPQSAFDGMFARLFDSVRTAKQRAALIEDRTVRIDDPEITAYGFRNLAGKDMVAALTPTVSGDAKSPVEVIFAELTRGGYDMMANYGADPHNAIDTLSIVMSAIVDDAARTKRDVYFFEGVTVQLGRAYRHMAATIKPPRGYSVVATSRSGVFVLRTPLLKAAGGDPRVATDQAVKSAYGRITGPAPSSRGNKVFNDVFEALRKKNAGMTARSLGNVIGYAEGGQAWVVADTAPLSQAKGIILHELGGHVGLPEMLGPAGFERLMMRVEQLRESDPDIASGYETAKRARTPDSQLNEEALAYAIQGAADETMGDGLRGLLKSLYNSIRAWLWRTFPGMRLADTLEFEDMRYLTMGALRHVSRTAPREIDASGYWARGVDANRASTRGDGFYAQSDNRLMRGDVARPTHIASITAISEPSVVAWRQHLRPGRKGPRVATRIIELSYSRGPTGDYLNPTEVAAQMLREGFFKGKRVRTAADLVDARRSLLRNGRDGPRVTFPSLPAREPTITRAQRTFLANRRVLDEEAYRLYHKGDSTVVRRRGGALSGPLRGPRTGWTLQMIGTRQGRETTEVFRGIARHTARLDEWRMEQEALVARATLREFGVRTPRHYEARDLIEMYNDQMTNDAIAAELSLDGQAINTATVRHYLVETRSAVHRAMAVEGGLARLSQALRMDEAELRAFLVVERRGPSMLGEARRLLASGKTGTQLIQRALSVYAEQHGFNPSKASLIVTISQARQKLGMLLQHIARTSPTQRATTIALRHAGLSGSEISERTGLNRNQVAGLIHRAMLSGEEFPARGQESRRFIRRRAGDAPSVQTREEAETLARIIDDLKDCK